jgi:peptidoglycan/LPS O-acetylase OafA/YrhL
MIKSLEGARGVAALIVALYHLKFGAAYFSAIRNGYLFVDLFFVLSGFVIATSYVERLHGIVDVRAFLIRRFGRLFPLLVFSTSIYVLTADAIVLAKRIAIANGHADVLAHPEALAFVIPSGPETVSTLTLTHGMGLFDALILNTPSWSISVEFYTYLLFATLCLFSFGKRRITAALCLSIAGLALSAWASVVLHHCLRDGGCMSVTYDFGFTRCIYSFFLGVLLHHFRSVLAVQPNLIQGLGCIVLALLLTIVDTLPAAAFFFPLVFAALVVAVSNDTGWLALVLRHPFCQMLGQRSYSIYLMHVPLLLLFDPFAKRSGGELTGAAVVGAYVAALLLVAGWTYRFVEDPFRVWFNHMASRAGDRGIAIDDADTGAAGR